MRDWLTLGGCIPNDQSLKQDLATPTYLYNSSGKIQLESKDDMKKRGMPSPDIGDALALTFSFPVIPKIHSSHPINRPRNDAMRGHDPFASRTQ